MTHIPVTLEAIGVRSYEELYALGTEETMRRISSAGVPLHEGDAFLAVFVLSSVRELRQSAERLDESRRRFERTTFALAVIATAATIGQLIQALS
jgi:hypothetical protein